MSFADAYLLKSGLRKALIEAEPHPGLDIAVIIPVYNESGLERCLDSLFACTDNSPEPVFRAEVLILINAPRNAPEEVLQQNKATFGSVLRWIDNHSHPAMDFHMLLDHSFRPKEAGVGTARKILMDEAVRRFSKLNRPEGILASLDADSLVEPNYLDTLAKFFQKPAYKAEKKVPDGCSIAFKHPRSSEENRGHESFAPEVYHAIAQYEDHLNYYLESVRSTTYPYAYHTVGSAFAVQAGIYVKEGGMNRRQGGEDFYFIQKVAQRGNFSECKDTCVHPSPRPSDRVPFGTGPVVRQLSSADQGSEKSILHTYHPEPFRMLRSLFVKLDTLYGNHSSYSAAMADCHPLLREFLAKHDFNTALSEIRSNSASLPAFRKRFWRWFSMFRIMKFLHFARERGFSDIPLERAIREKDGNQ